MLAFFLFSCLGCFGSEVDRSPGRGSGAEAQGHKEAELVLVGHLALDDMQGCPMCSGADDLLDLANIILIEEAA